MILGTGGFRLAITLDGTHLQPGGRDLVEITRKSGLHLRDIFAIEIDDLLA